MDPARNVEPERGAGVLESVRAVCLFALLVLSVAHAHAQDAGVDAAADAGLDPETAAFQRAIHSDPWTGTSSEEATDPLAAVDPTALAGVTDDPDVDEVEAPVPIRHGEIVEAIAGVAEETHEVTITLEGGLAVVSESMVLRSSARHRAEAMLRLALPPGAALVSLHVENASGARDGVLADPAAPQSAYDDALLVRSTTPSPRPVAHARLVEGAAGTSLVVRAAPVSDAENGELAVRVTWAVAVPMHGGVARLVLPARGSDDRASPPVLSLNAVDLVEPRVDGSSYERGAIDVRNDAPIVITALAPISRGPRVDAALVPCGAARCAILRATGARARVSAAPITIAIDASPSTSVGARGRIADTVRVLAALLPASTPVRFVAFAGRAELLQRGTPGELDLGRVRQAVDAHLGSATRFSALWALLESDARARDRILIVGDGGLTTGVLETATLEAARARGVIVGAIDVANRPPTEALASAVARTGGVVIEAGAAAERSAGGHGDEALTELVSAAVADTVGAIEARVDGRAIALGTLRTGESALFVGPASRAELAMGDSRATARAPDAAHAPVLVALAAHQAALIAVESADLDASAGACAPDGTARARPTARASSIVGHGLRIAPAHRRACASPVPAAQTTTHAASLPARVLRDQLRRRVIPPARRCFRDDRGGRAQLHREVTFELLLADREIVDASLDGEIPDALRACLLGAFDGVEVPAFDGALRVRWPVHTEAIAPPPVIELAPDVAREVRAIAGDTPIPTSPTP